MKLLEMYRVECCDGTVDLVWAPNLETAWEQACDMGLEVDSICEVTKTYQPE